MNIETFTRYQEEAAFDLPESWIGKRVFLYRVQDGEFVFWAEKEAENGAFRIQPASGRYLMLDEPLESFAEQADWMQREIADQERIRVKEDQKRAKTQKSLVIIGGSFFAVVVIGAVLAIVIYRKRK